MRVVKTEGFIWCTTFWCFSVDVVSLPLPLKAFHVQPLQTSNKQTKGETKREQGCDSYENWIQRLYWTVGVTHSPVIWFKWHNSRVLRCLEQSLYRTGFQSPSLVLAKSTRHWLTPAEYVGPSCAAKAAPTHQGMDSTRPLKVPCGIRYKDISSRFGFLIQYIPQVLDQTEIWGIWTWTHHHEQ